jgi:two-component system, chemotaxis family, sensor kinase CheA
MNTSRREALLARFRAGSIDRLRRVSLALIELKDGRGNNGALKEIARDLHTLKGESRMLGLVEMAEVVHAAEALLHGANEGKIALGEAAARTIAGLDVVAAVLREELGADAPKALLAAKSALETKATIDSKVDGAVAKVEATPEPKPEAPKTAETKTAPPPSAPLTPPRSSERWVQVNMGRIDELCGQVSGFASELRAFFTRVEKVLKTPGAGSGAIALGLREDLDRFRTHIDDISGSAWALRLVPVEPMLQDLARHAHDIASSQGKRARAVVSGASAEVERDILDALHEPLVHLVRNAVDHGLERPSDRGRKSPEGLLRIEAEPLGGNVVISVEDDGRGISPNEVRAAAVSKKLLREDEARSLSDRRALEILFTPGFSTRRDVTELSGRGVGLDVVREVIEKLGGMVTIQSTAGRGTRFELTVPSRISKERLLVFSSGGVLYALPSRQVREIMRHDAQVENVAGGTMIRYREEPVPFSSMSRTLSGGDESEPTVIILESGNRRWAYAVGSILGEFEIVRQPVDAIVAATGLIAASSVLDDGRLVLVLTLAALTRRDTEQTDAPATEALKTRVLAVDDSAVIRNLVERILLDAGFEVEVASNGHVALEKLEEYRPHLVVTDVEMPEMDGLELLRRIRGKSKSLPVVILSSRGAPDDLRKASLLGADAYLVKSSFQATTLVETVRTLSTGTS